MDAAVKRSMTSVTDAGCPFYVLSTGNRDKIDGASVGCSSSLVTLTGFATGHFLSQ